MTNTKFFLLLGTSLSLISFNIHAEQCTATPDCKTLGYTETSCPDEKGVRCPWNTSLWHCDSGKKDLCYECKIGMILNSDMTCTTDKTSGKTPIGVVADQTITTIGKAVKCQAVAVALKDLNSPLDWLKAESEGSFYTTEGVKGWRLATKDDLLAVYNNKTEVSSGLTAAGGNQFSSLVYWSSSVCPNYYGHNNTVDMTSGKVNCLSDNSKVYYGRATLDLTGLM